MVPPDSEMHFTSTLGLGLYTDLGGAGALYGSFGLEVWEQLGPYMVSLGGTGARYG